MMLALSFQYQGKQYTGTALRKTHPAFLNNKTDIVVEYFVDSIQPEDFPIKAITFTADNTIPSLSFSSRNIAQEALPLVSILSDAVVNACKNAGISLNE